ncbi:MAG: hypothetical protein ACI93N_001196 [Flavobacteriaceae bacterium]|jgi:hypothetical protein
MRNYFIYQYEDLVSSKERLRITVLFIHQTKIHSQNTLAQEINVFFQENSITDKLVIVLPKYLNKESLKLFFESRDLTFIRVPGNSSDYLDKSLIVYQFNESGKLDLIFGDKPKHEKKFISQLLRSGATIIFKNNGGLVESTPDHHFVFPSKKHCSKFIRTGNVLIHQTEIFFLAIQLLKHFENRNAIYCDTSSINVLPYGVFELLRRFSISFECPIVNSFESYEVFELTKESFPPDSLILISSSTSGNIIDRILKEKRAEKSQIQVIYFLGSKSSYLNHGTNIICNLTKEESFPIGEIEFDTFGNPDECKLCLNHSRPIHIRSDVFLTIQPKVEKHLLKVKAEYAPKHISPFIQRFRGLSTKERVIKVFHKDNNANADYEIYFDFVYLIANIKEFGKFDDSLNRHIDKSIPANTKCFLHLPDIGSEKLAEYIITKIPSSIKPTLVKLESGFTDKIIEDTGTVVIIASCITTGKKLLQISRLMRNRENLNLIYFVGIYRPMNNDFSIDLINDLKKGKNKSDERPFIAVETINCSIEQTATSWELERTFLEEFLGNIEEDENEELYRFVNERIDILRMNKEQSGLSDNVFLKKYNNKSLQLRPGFAFWNFKYSADDVAQSEVYLTISLILTNLENNKINSHPSLKQTNYVRNILSPRNFDRFNDGIIQSALLRSGRTEYFSYDLDSESSLKMKEFLFSIIENYDSEDGEALLEFLLAIGLKKLKLRKEDLTEVLNKSKECDNNIISGFSDYIYSKTLK